MNFTQKKIFSLIDFLLNQKDNNKVVDFHSSLELKKLIDYKLSDQKIDQKNSGRYSEKF